MPIHLCLIGTVDGYIPFFWRNGTSYVSFAAGTWINYFSFQGTWTQYVPLSMEDFELNLKLPINDKELIFERVPLLGTSLSLNIMKKILKQLTETCAKHEMKKRNVKETKIMVMTINKIIINIKTGRENVLISSLKYPGREREISGDTKCE